MDLNGIIVDENWVISSHNSINTEMDHNNNDIDTNNENNKNTNMKENTQQVDYTWVNEMDMEFIMLHVCKLVSSYLVEKLDMIHLPLDDGVWSGPIIDQAKIYGIKSLRLKTSNMNEEHNSDMNDVYNLINDEKIDELNLTTILGSKNWCVCDRLIIVCGGRTSPGIWSRGLCFDENILRGSAIPFVHQAMKQGYGVVILNPFQIDAVKNLRDKNRLEINDNNLLNNNNREVSILPEEHIFQAFNRYLKHVNASHIFLFGYGQGVEPLLKCAPLFGKKLAAISLTESYPIDKSSIDQFLIDKLEHNEDEIHYTFNHETLRYFYDTILSLITINWEINMDYSIGTIIPKSKATLKDLNIVSVSCGVPLDRIATNSESPHKQNNLLTPDSMNVISTSYPALTITLAHHSIFGFYLFCSVVHSTHYEQLRTISLGHDMVMDSKLDDDDDMDDQISLHPLLDTPYFTSRDQNNSIEYKNNLNNEENVNSKALFFWNKFNLRISKDQISKTSKKECSLNLVQNYLEQEILTDFTRASLFRASESKSRRKYKKNKIPSKTMEGKKHNNFLSRINEYFDDEQEIKFEQKNDDNLLIHDDVDMIDDEYMKQKPPLSTDVNLKLKYPQRLFWEDEEEPNRSNDGEEKNSDNMKNKRFDPVVSPASPVQNMIEFNKRYNQPPVLHKHRRWLEDKEVKFCMSCQSKFSKLLRKHHCRLCGRIFCLNCANAWRKIPRRLILSKKRTNLKIIHDDEELQQLEARNGNKSNDNNSKDEFDYDDDDGEFNFSIDDQVAKYEFIEKSEIDDIEDDEFNDADYPSEKRNRRLSFLPFQKNNTKVKKKHIKVRVCNQCVRPYVDYIEKPKTIGGWINVTGESLGEHPSEIIAFLAPESDFEEENANIRSRSTTMGAIITNYNTNSLLLNANPNEERKIGSRRQSEWSNQTFNAIEFNNNFHIPLEVKLIKTFSHIQVKIPPGSGVRQRLVISVSYDTLSSRKRKKNKKKQKKKQTGSPRRLKSRRELLNETKDLEMTTDSQARASMIALNPDDEDDLISKKKSVEISIPFSYKIPRIEYVSMPPTQGGIMEVIGKEFGLEQNAIIVKAGPFTCPFHLVNDQLIHVTIPEGGGINIPLGIKVGGQLCTHKFSYKSPHVNQIKVIHSNMIEIEGTNLGGVKERIEIILNSKPQEHFEIIRPHFHIRVWIKPFRGDLNGVDSISNLTETILGLIKVHNQTSNWFEFERRVSIWDKELQLISLLKTNKIYLDTKNQQNEGEEETKYNDENDIVSRGNRLVKLLPLVVEGNLSVMNIGFLRSLGFWGKRFFKLTGSILHYTSISNQEKIFGIISRHSSVDVCEGSFKSKWGIVIRNLLVADNIPNDFNELIESDRIELLKHNNIGKYITKHEDIFNLINNKSLWSEICFAFEDDNTRNIWLFAMRSQIEYLKKKYNEKDGIISFSSFTPIDSAKSPIQKGRSYSLTGSPGNVLNSSIDSPLNLITPKKRSLSMQSKDINSPDYLARLRNSMISGMNTPNKNEDVILNKIMLDDIRLSNSMKSEYELREIIQANSEFKNKIPWVKDEIAIVCAICGDRFGVFCRKHHCRQCGCVVCDSCSKNQRKVIGYNEKQRVCNICNDNTELAIQKWKSLFNHMHQLENQVNEERKTLNTIEMKFYYAREEKPYLVEVIDQVKKRLLSHNQFSGSSHGWRNMNNNLLKLLLSKINLDHVRKEYLKLLNNNQNHDEGYSETKQHQFTDLNEIIFNDVKEILTLENDIDQEKDFLLGLKQKRKNIIGEMKILCDIYLEVSELQNIYFEEKAKERLTIIENTRMNLDMNDQAPKTNLDGFDIKNNLNILRKDIDYIILNDISPIEKYSSFKLSSKQYDLYMSNEEILFDNNQIDDETKTNDTKSTISRNNPMNLTIKINYLTRNDTNKKNRKKSNDDEMTVFLYQFYNELKILRLISLKSNTSTFSELSFFTILPNISNPNCILTAWKGIFHSTLNIWLNQGDKDIFVQNILIQIVEGLDFLHNNGIIHGDLCLDNILIDTENMKIKLINFGYSKLMDDFYSRYSFQLDNKLDTTSNDSLPNLLHILNEKSLAMIRKFSNTPIELLAPEYRHDEFATKHGFNIEEKTDENIVQITEKVDIWSLGVIMIQLLTDLDTNVIINDEIDIIFQEKSAENTKNIKLLTGESIDLLRKLLQIDPRERISTNIILSHRFMTIPLLHQLQRNDYNLNDVDKSVFLNNQINTIYEKTRTELHINVHRNNIVNDLHDVISTWEKDDYFSDLVVHFVEDNEQERGYVKDLFNIYFSEIIKTEYNIFEIGNDTNHENKNDDHSDALYLPSIKNSDLELLENFGKVLIKALIEKQILPNVFAPTFYQFLLQPDHWPTEVDLLKYNPNMMYSLKESILNTKITEEYAESNHLTFDDFKNNYLTGFITEATKQIYYSLRIQKYLLTDRFDQLHAIRNGFCIIGEDLVKNITQNITPLDLKNILTGLEDITSEFVLDNIDFSLNENEEYNISEYVTKWISNLTKQQLKKFIRFATGMPNLPIKGLNSRGQNKISINISKYINENNPPKSFLCYNHVQIAQPNSYEEFTNNMNQIF